MWTRVLLGLCAFAAASASVGWEDGSKYTYQVSGRTLTALHQVADQYVGILTTAQLEIFPRNPRQLIAVLTNAQFAKIEKVLPGGWGSAIADDQLSYEQLPLSSKPIEIHLKGGVINDMLVDASLPTWEINMVKGIVSQLQMDLKGKHLIHSPENQMPTAENKNGVFKTMEQSVTGRCEVQYDISALPEYVLQSRPELAPLPELRQEGDFIDVVKSTNFSHCAQRPVYNYGFPGFQRLELASNQMGDAIARSSVSRAVLSGDADKYTIQSSVTTQKAIYSPNLYNEQKGMIVSRMNVTLTKYSKVSEQPAPPQHPRRVRDLIYTFTESYSGNDAPWDDMKTSSEEQGDARLNSNAARRFRHSLKNQQEQQEQSTNEEESNWSTELKQEYKQKPEFDQPRKASFVLSSAISRKLVNPVRSAIALSKQIAEDLQNPSALPEKATLSKFTTLSLLARSMSTKQIQDVVHELYVPASHAEPSRDSVLQRASWNAWRDAVTQAGTGPALVNMKEWIVKGMVNSHEAAHMLTHLPTAARYPDKDYIHFLFRLTEHPQVKKDRTVYTAALLSFTTLLRLGHVDKVAAKNRYPAYIFGRLNPKDETRVDRYIGYYSFRLRKAVEKQDATWIQTYTVALGNIGHPRVLKTFEPYLEGDKPITLHQRRLMLVSMNPVIAVSPKFVRATAFRVYQSTSEEAQMRTLAAVIIMKTNPPANMIQRMAESTQFEHNEQVRSVVKSLVESVSNLKAGEDWERISNARAAVKNLNETRSSIHYSQGLHFSKDIEDMQLTLRGSLHTVGKEDSLLPHSIFASYGKSFNGIKMADDNISFLVSSIQNLYERLFNDVKPEPQSQQQVTDDLEHPLWSHNGIASTLGVINNQSEPLEASLFLRTVGVTHRFFAFDNQTIEHLRHAYKHIWTQLQHGEMKFNHNRLFTSEEMIMMIPTPMGLPATFRIATPMYYAVSGKVHATSEAQQEQASGKSFVPNFNKIVSDVHYVVSSKIQAQLSFVTPFDNKKYASGIEKDMQINMPVRAEIEIDRENSEVRAKLQPAQPEQKTKMLIIRSRPYTSQEDMLKLEPANQNIIHVRKAAQTNLTIGQDTTGMAFDIDFSSERQFLDMAEAVRKVQKNQIVSAILKSIAEPIQHCELIVSYNPEKSSAKVATFTAAYETKKAAQQQANENQKDEQLEQDNQGEQQEQEIEQLINNEQHESEGEWLKDLTEGHTRRQSLLKSLTQKIKGSQSSVLHLIAKFHGEKEAQFVASASLTSSPVSKYSHAELHLHQSPVNKEYTRHIAVHATTKKPLPPMTNYKKALEAQHKASIDAVVIMIGKGLSTDKPAVVRITTDMKQNAEQREYVLNSRMAQLCNAQMKQGNNFLPACQNVTVSANLMNEYDTRVEYKRIAEEVKNATYKAYSFARYLGWEYYTENALNASNKDNTVRVHTRFAPDEQSVNVTIAAPAMNAHFKNIRLSPVAAAATIAHAAYTPSQMVALRLLRDQFYPSCVIDRKAVNTFNNMTYSLDTAGSWHVLLHTAYQMPARHPSQLNNNVTVLGRKVGASEDKELRVILGSLPYRPTNVVELIPSNKFVQVKVNNETVRISSHRVSEFRDENNQVFARMYATPDRSIRFVAPQHNIELLYRPSVTVISAANSLRNQVRGLCGTFNSEVATDFTVPKNCIIKQSDLFVASYAVWPTGTDAQRQQEALKAPCFGKSHKFANVVAEWKDEHNSKERDSHEMDSNEDRKDCEEDIPKPKPDECSVNVTGIKVMKIEGQLCFSLRPQIICHAQCTATTKIEQVEFHCLPKNSSNARHWQSMIKLGATLDLAGKPANKVMNIPVVESCQP